MPSPETALQTLAEEAARCAKCGACTAVCPIYRLTGRESLASRGRLHLLTKLPRQEATTSPLFSEILSQCLLCGACADACPRGLNLPWLVIRARHELGIKAGEDMGLRRAIRTVLASPLLLGGASAAAKKLPDSLVSLLPEASGLRLRLVGLRAALPAGNTLPISASTDESPGKSSVQLFAGCFALHLDRSIIESARLLIRKTHESGLSLPDAQVCCGLAAASAGDLRAARRLAQKNIAAFRPNEAPILVTCASCFSHLSSYPELFRDDIRMHAEATSFAARLREFSTFFDTAPNRLLFPQVAPGIKVRQVLYHDPCHLRFRHRITLPPRRLLMGAPATKLVELPGSPRCCGQGGLFNIAHPGLARGLRVDYRAACQVPQPDVIVTTCTGCLLGLRESLGSEGKAPAILHLASYLAENLRHSL